MTSNTQDQWAQWLLHRRFGGDLQRGQAMLKELSVWRDRIFGHATIAEGETVLDVGCGDGLIAFGALDRVGEEGFVRPLSLPRGADAGAGPLPVRARSC